MSSYGNFNVKPFEDLKEQASKVLGDIIENITTVKNECATMSDIVMSDDSKLGTRWRELSEKMAQPIETIEDTSLVVKSLLDAYITNTLANEEQATKELEAIDEGITTLSTRAETLLNGLTALRGIGFGATAIVIPGLAGYDPSITEASVEVADGTVEISDSIAVTKYAPPSIDAEITTKYAAPTAPAIDAEITTKYAAPTVPALDAEITTKYAAPTVPALDAEITTKYAAPTVPALDAHITTKYAAPTYSEITPVTKYAPPNTFSLSDSAVELHDAGSGFSYVEVASDGKLNSGLVGSSSGIKLDSSGTGFYTQSGGSSKLKGEYVAVGGGAKLKGTYSELSGGSSLKGSYIEVGSKKKK